MTLREVNRVGEGQKNVPKLRFKGYEDAWEQSELGEVLCELYNGQTPSRFREENWNGDINWLTSGELNRGTVYKTIEKITRIGQVDANLRIVPEGVFVMAITGLEAAGTRGNCAILGIPTTLNQSCMALFPKDNILFTGFLFQWYKKNGEKYGLVYTQGTKQRSYNAELIKKLPIAFPDYDEQKRLSTILRKLDKSLTLYQDLIEGLQKMKKTILSKMFPKDGEDVPEIRFKGFTDAWEQRKLGEVCERVVRKNKNYESDLPLTIASQFGLIDQRDFFGKIVAAKDMSNYYLLKKGEFAYNKSYSKGFDFGSIKRLNNYELGCLSTLYICFQIASNRVESDYLEVYFDTLNWYKDVMSICAEGARNHGLLNVDTKAFFEEVNVDIPREILEQKNIASSLEKVEKLITLHQRKLDELKNMKKTLLQQMFV